MLVFTDKGIYCPRGDFYIDPWKPVQRAVITHAHSDHARWGSSHYLSHHFTVPLLRLRLGDVSCQGLEWGEPIFLNGVKLTLHPAGHIIGSSQVRVEYKGEVWVFSGDYKTVDDGLSGKFEVVRCHSFITESTFGLPIYHWKPQEQVYEEMRNWVNNNRENGRSSVFQAYSLGKAQRVADALADSADRIFAHGAIWNTHEILRDAGHKLPYIERITAETKRDLLKGAVVIAPPSADGTPWIRKFQPYALGVCSGWMQVRGNARRRNADTGFALSDHADWKGLVETVKSTGAEKVFVTHGFQAAFARYLNESGIHAAEVRTSYGEEEDDKSVTEE